MAYRVLILGPEQPSSRKLMGYFTKRKAQVWLTSDPTQAYKIVKAKRPHLAFLDLHIPDNGWLHLLDSIHQESKSTRVIITNRHPDIRREMLAKEHGAQVFLREPFTNKWIETALKKMYSEGQEYPPPLSEGHIPSVRVPMRLKITLPFTLLAVIFASSAVFVGSRFIIESISERFTNQLIDAATLSTDWMVQEENRILDTERLISNTEGVAGSIKDRDANQLRRIILPIAINYQEEIVEILDPQGTSLLSLRQRKDGNPEDYEATQGDNSASQWEPIQKVLAQQIDTLGDKYAGIGHSSWGDFFYITGPIIDQDGSIVGVLMIGKSLSTLARQIRQDTLAQITIYDLNGDSQVSTVLIEEDISSLSPELVQQVLNRQDEQSIIRNLKVASATYSEILGPWEARSGQDLGVVGVSLAENFFIQPSLVTRFQAFFIITFTFLAVIAIGLFLARQITAPLSQVVQSFTRVAQGDLDIRVPTKGNDEISVLAHAFNFMVSGLQEGDIYRDLLGRTVSPEVREALRTSFARGDLRLQGRNIEATVLMSDIRGFTTLAEKEDPATVMRWLNNYYAELVPIIISHGGVVDKFEGDALVAFFGILPTPLTPEESAIQACESAIEMLQVIARINRRRAERGEPAFITGIGINTGPMTAGGLGTADRMNFTVIGDTVNTTQRIKDITREFGESGVVISENTLKSLQKESQRFHIESLGQHTFKGKLELLWLYRLWPAKGEQYPNPADGELHELGVA
jgi:class 3 adenylate cyclase/ActR/RegA family two-component response regulator